MGATASAGTFLEHFAKAQDGVVYYQNNIGEIVPASPDAMSQGIFPSQVPAPSQPAIAGGASHAPERRHLESASRSHSKDHGSPAEEISCSQTSKQAGYKSPNFLMIMVDQLRAPRWLPSGGQAALDALLPNITYLRNHSHSFSNYFVAATACSPSRSTLLTGLYTQQTCIFQTQDAGGCQPVLQTGFPNIATVLSQSASQVGGSWIPYNCFWIGKWHLSDNAIGGVGMGANGPVDYGFTTTPPVRNLPDSNLIPSPNGLGNLATEGINPSGFSPTHGSQPTGTSAPAPSSKLYCDAAIADFFVSTWLPNAPSTPWFTAVSFVNPHDISAFPFSYNLTGLTGFGGTPSAHPGASFPPPLTAGSAGTGTPGSNQYYDTGLPSLPALYTAVPSGWNYPDAPSGICNTSGFTVTWGSGNTFDASGSWSGRSIIINGVIYTISSVSSTTSLTLTSSAGSQTGVSFVGSSAYNGGNGKPDLQAAFQRYINNTNGAVTASSGWVTFFNYYLWMQKCVDIEIGRVLQALSSPSFPDANHTIVIFHSDHGDYGGSHGLKAKGGALYDESINVPLYISFPGQRSGATPAPPTTKSFVCSTVDVLPFLYATALGSDAYWRQNNCDIIAYLNKRESILDAIFSSTTKQHRISGIPNAGGAYNGQNFQPFILHTTDEFPDAIVGSVPAPSHAVAFRTVDLTVTQTNADGNTVNGGGKLGIYSYWPTPNPSSPDGTQTQPATAQPQQFEFYDYTGTANLSETGNEYLTSSAAAPMVTAFNSAGQAELYATAQQPWLASWAPYQAALLDYLNGCPAFGPSTDL